MEGQSITEIESAETIKNSDDVYILSDQRFKKARIEKIFNLFVNMLTPQLDNSKSLRESIDLGETTQSAVSVPRGIYEARTDGYVLTGHGDYKETVFCKKGSILLSKQITPYYASTYIINQDDIIIDESVEDLNKIVRLSELHDIKSAVEALGIFLENLVWANPKRGEVISATGELDSLGHPGLEFISLPPQKEFIKTITLTEECVSIVIDKDENGNAFDLSYAEIVFDVPAGTRTNCNMFLNNLDELNAKAVSLTYLIYTDAQKRMIKIQCFPNSSFVEYFYTTIRSDYFEESNISAVKFMPSSEVNFPVGTKIDLYGVRNS